MKRQAEAMMSEPMVRARNKSEQNIMRGTVFPTPVPYIAGGCTRWTQERVNYVPNCVLFLLLYMSSFAGHKTYNCRMEMHCQRQASRISALPGPRVVAGRH